MAYTEILLPQAYVNDPGGNDFWIDNWVVGAQRMYGNWGPAEAVTALAGNDSDYPPAAGPGADWGPHRYWGRYVWWFGAHDRGRFTIGDPTINGVVQSVGVRLLLYLLGGAALGWVRLWTHGVQYEQGGLVLYGVSSYPPGVGWPIFGWEWAVNPNTGLAWTLNEVRDLDAGFRLDAPPLNLAYIDQIYVLVTYSLIPPTVATQAATGVLPSQATINGSLVDDGGQVCTLFLEWGNSPSLGNVAPAGTGSTGASFSATIAGLLTGQNYFFRAGATNAQGTVYGAILSLTSSGGGEEAITVFTMPATVITENGGLLRGMVQNSLGRYGDVRFEWGGTTAYGNTTPWQSGFTTGDLFEFRLRDLVEGSVYHFRAQFRDSGIVSGSDGAFATLSSLGPVVYVSEELMSRVLDKEA